MGFPEDRLEVLEFGLHNEPEKLKAELQSRIDEVTGEGEILLGYGLCSYAVVGLVSRTRRLVVPRVQDCISLFLGSEARRLGMLAEEPGTYFLTKGWIESVDSTYAELERLTTRYGEERARRVIKVMLANYTRVALIDTGNYRMDEYREFARTVADALELRFEELPGSNRLLQKMLSSDWDSEFVVAEPGEPVELERFLAYDQAKER